jgi:hypothetical protein
MAPATAQPSGSAAAKKEEMKALYFEIKAVFGKRDKTFLKKKNRKLYELVEKNGGAPDRDRAAFWTTIMKEWNIRNPKAKYTTANGPRINFGKITPDRCSRRGRIILILINSGPKY